MPRKSVLLYFRRGQSPSYFARKTHSPASKMADVQFSVFSFQFSVFSFQFSVFSFQFSVFSFQFSVFSFQCVGRNKLAQFRQKSVTGPCRNFAALVPAYVRIFHAGVILLVLAFRIVCHRAGKEDCAPFAAAESVTGPCRNFAALVPAYGCDMISCRWRRKSSCFILLPSSFCLLPSPPSLPGFAALRSFAMTRMSGLATCGPLRVSIALAVAIAMAIGGDGRGGLRLIADLLQDRKRRGIDRLSGRPAAGRHGGKVRNGRVAFQSQKEVEPLLGNL